MKYQKLITQAQEAARAASIRRHLPFLTPTERMAFAPTASELAVVDLARRMGVQLPGARS